VTPDHPELAVDFAVGEEAVAARVFRDGEADQTLHIPLADGLTDEHGRLIVDVLVNEPARPVDLGLGADPRRLGLHLRSLELDAAPVTAERRRQSARGLRRRLWKA
jgi:hypothetical protein